MADQFGRAYRLVVGDTEISNIGLDDGLRIDFAIERSTSWTPNTAEVRIYNLSDETRERLETGKDSSQKLKIKTKHPKKIKGKLWDPKEGISVRLEVGYQKEGVGQIFFGALRDVRSKHEGADWVTSISGGDGETNLRLARVALSFAMGTPCAAVISQLAAALGLKTGNANPAGALSLTDVLATQGLYYGTYATLTRPLTIVGYAAEELDRFVRSCGLSWSVADGAIQIMKDGAALPSTSLLSFSPDTGLVGEVQTGVAGEVKQSDGQVVKRTDLIEGRVLMQPTLLPGTMFMLQSKRATGAYWAISTKHWGDTHASADAWCVDFQAQPNS